MRHFVNIAESADLAETLLLLALCGSVTMPNDRTPRAVLVECAHDESAGIEAIPGVCGCCDANTSNTLCVLAQQTPGRWNIALIDGQNDGWYGHRGPTPILAIDTHGNPGQVPGMEIVFETDGVVTDHCTGTMDIARRANPYAPIKVFVAFDGNEAGTIAMAAAAQSAAADWAEDNLAPGTPFVVCSAYQGPAGSNPYAAVEQRLRTLGGVLIAAAGNGGDDLNAAALWPANGADYRTGNMDINGARVDDSSFPADIYAGGHAIDFLRADGSIQANATGTSPVCSLVSAVVALDIDAEGDPDTLFGLSVEQVTNLVPGDTSGAILFNPTNETPPPPPPPPPPEVGTGFMRYSHVGDPQPVPDQLVTPLAWETAPGVFETTHTVEAGVTQISLRTWASIDGGFPHGKQGVVRILDAAGNIVTGGLSSTEFKAGEFPDHQIGSMMIEVQSAILVVTEGDTFTAAGWHNGGDNITFNNVKNADGSAVLGFEMRDETPGA